MARPINERNAIESTTFAVLLDAQLTDRQIEAMQGLKDTLKSELPSFNVTQKITAQFNGTDISQSLQTGGVLLQHFNTAGKPTWILKIEGNLVAVSCLDYVDWDEEKPKALNLISKALAAISCDRVNVATLGLQVVDKFKEPMSEYEFANVLNPLSRFVTKQAIESGPLWHTYQGWFDVPPSDGNQLLNILNLTANEENNEHTLTIDHQTQLMWSQSVSAPDDAKQFFDSLLDDLHRRNKEVVKELLNDQQKAAIHLV